MKPLSATAKPLPERVSAPELRRVPRPSAAELRAERDRFLREGDSRRALRVAERLMRLEPSRETVFRYGIALRDSGNPRGSIKVFRDALRYREGAAYLVPEIHLHLAYAWYQLNESKRMGESLRRAYASRPRPRSEFSLHLVFSNHYLANRKYLEAQREAVEAERAGRTPQQRGRALVNQAVALFYQRRLDEAFRFIHRAVRILEKGGGRSDAAYARYVRGCFHSDEGQYARTVAVSMRAARQFEALGELRQASQALHAAGYASLELGRSEEALGYLDRAIEQADRTGDRHLQITSRACRARAHALQDDFARAAEDLAEAKHRLQGCRDLIASQHLYRTQAELALIFGRWDEVRRWARRGERLSQRGGDPVRVAQFRKIRARAEEELGRRRAALHARKTASALGILLGTGSRSGREALRLGTRLARSSVPVLLVGESGAGKTDLAREMHRSGPRPKGPCVVVPCEQLLFAASEVAGHEAGAWSGARERSDGYARSAAGGTLILDRVDELSPEAQRVLVPVVEGRVRPVGSAVEARLDFRIIAVARDVRRLIPELRGRLEGAVLVVPPLRERAEDLPALIREQLGGRSVTADALALLAAHRWEGNLPELRAKISELLARTPEAIGVKAVRAVLRTPEARRVAARAAALRRMAEALR